MTLRGCHLWIQKRRAPAGWYIINLDTLANIALIALLVTLGWLAGLLP